MCVDFERAWKAGRPPVIEDYCPDDDSLAAQAQFQELLLLDLDYRRRAGESVRWEQYRERFPRYSEIVTGLWAETLPTDGQIVPPPEIPGYVVGEQLGRGGMGIVYRGWQTALKRPVALKLIRSGALADESEQARFRAEAEAVARLEHPNIVQVHDIGSAHGQLYLALQYCPHGTLAARCGTQPQSPAYAAETARTIAAAVAFAHSKSVIHRDLKPANILLAEDDRPVIADFGLARLLGDGSGGTRTGEIAGTPSYLAPEQARGGPAASAPGVDIYAIGAILYELLTGQPPFRGPTAMETVRLVLEHEPVAPRRLQPTVPRDLDTIAMKCLAKEPARRYASAHDLAQDLRRYLSGEAIVARPVSAVERAARWARRRPAVAALSLGLLAAMLIGLVAWYQFTVQLADARAEAARQRDQAVNNLKAARSAVQTFLRQVTNESRFKEAASPQLRRRLLELAKQYYDDLPPTAIEDSTLLAEQIATLIDLSRMMELFGESDDALAALRRASALSSELAGRSPDSTALRIQIAAVHNDFGHALSDRKQYEKARGEYQAAIAISEPLLGEPAHRERVLFQLGSIYNNLGVLLRRTNDLPGAEQAHRRALELREQLPKHVGDYLNGVAQSWHNLGSVYQSAGKIDESERHYQQAVDRRAAILDREPDYAEYSMALISSLQSLGVVQRGRGKFEAAGQTFERALAVADQLNQKNPGVPSYEAARARLLRERDRTREAEKVAPRP